MLKLLFLFLLLSTSAFARTLILSKNNSSSSNLPHAVFLKDCKVYSEGYAVITTRAGSGPTIIRKQYVSYRRILTIESLVRIAIFGRIVTVGATCDGGNKLLDGYLRGTKILLDEDIDCGNHKVNQSPATPFLANRSRNICGF